MSSTRTTHTATNVRKERTFRSPLDLDAIFGAGGRVDAYLQRQICQRIKKARKAAGFTQEDMASLLSVTARAYQNYERDRVPFRRLAEIARLTGVEQDWLLRGDPQNQPSPALLKDVADGVEQLERSQESVLQKLDEVLAHLARLEAERLPPEEKRPGQNPS